MPEDDSQMEAGRQHGWAAGGVRRVVWGLGDVRQSSASTSLLKNKEVLPGLTDLGGDLGSGSESGVRDPEHCQRLPKARIWTRGLQRRVACG